jgi:hypothetical protein
MTVKTTQTPAQRAAAQRREDKKVAKAAAEERRAKFMNRLKLVVAVFLGLLIPTMTMISSYYAGLVWATHPVIAVCFITIGIMCMAVSIGHLKWAVQYTIPASDKAAWTVAIIIDGLIALMEMLNTTEYGGWLSVTVLATMWLASVLLNTLAFLFHDNK